MELSGIRNLDTLKVPGKTVLVRVDFNAPFQDGVISDDGRIRAALPTINALREQDCRVVLASHRGRPNGERVRELSLVPIGERLAELLDCDICVPDDCVGDGAKKVIRDLPPRGVVLLENLRFHTAETKGDSVFASELASLADAYVNDAFGTAHRAHASTYTVARFFSEDKRAAGRLIERELEHLNPLLLNAETPFLGILGGAKVSDKIAVIENLLGRLNTLLIGGAMAYTFLAARGESVGSSLVQPDMLEIAKRLLVAAEATRTKLLLPTDHVIAAAIGAEKGDVTEGASIPFGMAGFDIGPKTIELYKQEIARARTVFWNGPMGVFESSAFDGGTFAVAHALGDSKATVVVGGGDSAAALKTAGRSDDVTHVSTGGGASL
ncbi:MAG: phosphoglycerate kinase, partial [Flavobacteriales bacterium]